MCLADRIGERGVGTAAVIDPSECLGKNSEEGGSRWQARYWDGLSVELECSGGEGNYG